MRVSLWAELCARMAARYGHRWTSQYASDDSREGLAAAELAQAEWTQTLAGVDATQMLAGLAADVRRGDGWPPSSTEFRAMCLGVPTFAELRYESLHPELPRSEFGQQWRRYIDPFALAHASAADADRMRREAYELTRQFVLAGNTLPDVPRELPPPPRPEKRYASPEEALRHVQTVIGTVERLDAADAARKSVAAPSDAQTPAGQGA
jgi:hypothetical protein